MRKPVMVVDDDSATCRVVTYGLRALQVDIITAENGMQAIELAQEQQLALVIVDINLPGMDGFEVIRHLKAIPHLQDTPMIIFTARSQTGDRASAQEAGAVDFLYKPFSTEELRDLVSKYLDQT